MIGNKKIIKIEEYGEHETYDLKVADTHNFFLANGILTHNSGKDCITQYMVNNDIKHGRTVIVLDVKNEYPSLIFANQDPILKKILIQNGLVGKGEKVILWLPYTSDMEGNSHFQGLLKLHHPNLEIRPFRILKDQFVSEDSASMALSLTQIQSLVKDTEKLTGISKQSRQAREEMARQKLGFDDNNIWMPGCGWEYINFDEMTLNKRVNVISTFFLMGINKVSAVSFMIGIINELMTIGQGVHRFRGNNESFSIVIPELQIVMPQGVKQLDQAVQTLKYSLSVCLLLMRSYDVRLRTNLQNLSNLDPSMASQSEIYVGRTWNVKDLNMLGKIGVSRKERTYMMHQKVGNFTDVMGRRRFSVVPFSHKAREKEPFIGLLNNYKKDPSSFLFETRNGFLSEVIDTDLIGGRFPMTVKEYNHRMKKWISEQKSIKLAPIELDEDPESEDAPKIIEQKFGEEINSAKSKYMKYSGAVS